MKPRHIQDLNGRTGFGTTLNRLSDLPKKTKTKL
ncbi:MAG: hypothetical protein ACJARX_001277 [Psychroserpens sp.]|jgi:hypothetical protein